MPGPAMMMTSFHTLKEDLQQICTGISSYLVSARELPGVGMVSFKEWETICRTIKKQMDEEIIRVAVVGAIKSGKSTFVNSLFKADHLNRGAGVVTSIVTRIRQGPYLKAKLYFKSWDEVNEEISFCASELCGHDEGKPCSKLERVEIRNLITE